MNLSTIQETLEQSIAVKQSLLTKKVELNKLVQMAETCTSSLLKGGKILFCGNGGSAADAQHLAAELTGRFYYDRDPLFAEALQVNNSYLTAVANDYSFDLVYSRLVKAKGRKGDVLIALSTSGNSTNVNLALSQAKKTGMHTFGLTGMDGGKMNELCDVLLKVPSSDTPRIQECHIWAGHAICQLIEAKIYPQK